MSDHSAAADSDSAPVRPLPPRPSLEFERKQAKKLLQQLRRSDVNALTRLALHRSGSPRVTDLKLADAQFVIAREYGFASWPRLVEYFTTLHRHERSWPEAQYQRDFYDRQVENVMAAHARAALWVERALAIYVPRFYGLSVDQVVTSAITQDDARLVIARQSRFPSWDALMQSADRLPRDPWTYFASSRMKANDAISAGDLPAVQRIIAEHPELVQPRKSDEHIDALVWNALCHERDKRTPQARRITDWIVAQGFNLQDTLNLMLLGAPRMKTEHVAFALERGADPAWVAPNGLSVLEHAIYRYRNGEAVDLIARRVVPRKAFWIAAGLGDVRSLPHYIDRAGKPTAAAVRNRPDFMALGPYIGPSLPLADDREVVWEAFLMAGLNGRFAVLDAILERGFPIDYSASGWSLLQYAVTSELVPLVEFLVERGADVALPMHGARGGARASAANGFLHDPSNPAARRIFELCGGDPEAVFRRDQERRARPTQIGRTTLDLAGEEAVRLGQPEVQPHNVFIALLRDRSAGLVLGFLARAGVDLGLLRKSVEHRLLPAAVAMPGQDVPLSTETEAVFQSARSAAQRARREEVGTLHLLYALAEREAGPVADILAAAGGTAGTVRKTCERNL